MTTGYYTLGPDRYRRDGFRDRVRDLFSSPPPPDDHKWHGVRRYWAESYGGDFISFYDEGVTAGKEDLTNNNAVNFTALDTVTADARDTAWQAKLDGYKDATREARGPTKYG